MESQEQLNGPENARVEPGRNEAQAYSVPWKPIDNWIGVFLLILVLAVVFAAAVMGLGQRVAQSASLIVVQLMYLIPVIVVFAYRRVPVKSLGFRKFDPAALGVGCGLLLISYMIILVHNLVLMALGVEPQGQQIMDLFAALDSPIWFMVVGVVFAPIIEEIFFRGFLFQGLRPQYGWIRAGLISSTIFAVGHLDPVALIPTFILGCLLAYMYHRTNSVWPGIILHFLVNALGMCAAYATTQLPPDLIPV
ncbi:MAG TPA: type II CAAX endopeptidase family protein [Anaerolineales bacterium]|nr:type II CAAX endopeptidase family protein [Anaerolineales bacterium]